jgi:hypothetical protein
MSYTLTNDSNPTFNLMALITAPMLQTAVMCKLREDRSVDLVLQYEGLVVNRGLLAEAEDNDPCAIRLVEGLGENHPGAHQQVAKFFIVESFNKDVEAGNSLLIPLTATTLEHSLFAFIPKIFTEQAVAVG